MHITVLSTRRPTNLAHPTSGDSPAARAAFQTTGEPRRSVWDEGAWATFVVPCPNALRGGICCGDVAGSVGANATGAFAIAAAALERSAEKRGMGCVPPPAGHGVRAIGSSRSVLVHAPAAT